MAGLARWLEARLSGLGRGGAAALLIVVSLAMFLPGFATMPPLDRDEPRFAQASRQMLDTGDFVDPRFRDDPRHKKPVGIYWLQSAAVAATGATEGAALWRYRLPSLLAAVAAVLMTARIAADFAGPRAGLAAGLMFAGVFSLGMEARIAKTDAVLLLTVVVAQWVLARLWRAAREPGAAVALPLPLVLAFWLAVAAGILVKGPVGVMVTGLAALVLALGLRRAGWLGALRPGLGLVLVAALVLPWYVAITIRSDGGFWAASLGQDMLAKVAAGQENHGAPPGTYLAVMWLTFFPAAAALALVLPAIWRARRSAAVVFAAAWAIPAWLVFEATLTKLTHYVLPLYPALVLAVALVWDEAVAAPRRLWHWLAFGAVTLLPVAALAAIGAYAATLGPVPWAPLALGLAAIGLGAALTRQALTGGLALAAAAGLAVMGWGFAAGLVRGVTAVQAVWPAPRIVAAAVGPDCPAPTIRNDGFDEPSLTFLSPGPVRPLGADDPVAALAEPCARVLLPTSASGPMTQAGARPLARITGLSLGSGKSLDLTLWAAP
ncbi:MAG: glycosyltransferase family 39 protein [Rhodobacteraceae bacterium]|nr:glycosyltransferase family 39 protein [Paracoccaceae bacterium]